MGLQAAAAGLGVWRRVFTAECRQVVGVWSGRGWLELQAAGVCNHHLNAGAGRRMCLRRSAEQT